LLNCLLLNEFAVEVIRACFRRSWRS
jgi:hypothetical protein